jgi:hypothetical protein
MNREAFEASYASSHDIPLETFSQYRMGDTYRLPGIASHWRTWKMALESVVVELPPPYPVPEEPEFAMDDSHMDAYHAANGMRHACSKFIESAGLKVTP